MGKPTKAAGVNPQALFDYAVAYRRRAESNGRGSQFPTIRQAARRFSMKQGDVLSLAEAGDDISGCDYFGVAVGVGIAGSGWAEHDRIGDYVIEAWEDAADGRS